MTTARPLLHVQLIRPSDRRVTGARCQLTFNPCRESHKTQVWLCLLALSFFSASTFGFSVKEIADLQFCLRNLKPSIERSDAMLYAPSMNDIKEKCKRISLKCYMLELIMVINEEEIDDDYAECIIDFNQALRSRAYVGCPPCEAHPLGNATIFLDRLNNLLEAIAH